MHRTFLIATHGPDLHVFSRDVAAWVTGKGLLTLFVRHTSCSLLIQENAEPDARRDLQASLHRLVPPADGPSMGYLVHRDEGPNDMPAHIKAALLPVSLQVPVTDGRMVPGTWQGVYLVQHRAAPHRRQVVAHLAQA